MTQPDYDLMALNRQLEPQGLLYLMEPLLVVWCSSLLLKDAASVEWDKAAVHAVLQRALDEDDLSEDLKELVRPWLAGKRPDLVRYAKSWKDTYSEEHHGVLARISEGLSRTGQPAKRFFVGDRRVSEQVFNTLICDQEMCPRHREMLKRFEGGAKVAERKAHPPLLVTKLEEEKPMEWDGKTVLARRAKLTKVFECAAHDPLRWHVEAWDLYGEDGYITTL